MKELSTETRVLLAFSLSLLVMAVWGMFFKPTPSEQPRQSTPSQAATPGKAPVPTASPTTAPATMTAAPPERAPAPKAAAAEGVVVVENNLYRVEISNRGGVVRSWQLKKYKDDFKPPRTLDVVHAEASARLGGWPLSIILDDPQIESQINSALFEVFPEKDSQPLSMEGAPAGHRIRGPGELRLEWSDGRLAVSKRLRFAHDYIVGMDTSVTLDGKPLAHAVAWRGGFGDTMVYMPAEQVKVFFRANGKIEMLEHKSLGTPDHAEQRLRHIGTMDYAGIEDRYFAAVFLPRGAGPESVGAGLAGWHWKLTDEVTVKEKKEQVPVAEMAAGSTVAGPLALRLFVGPKDLDVVGNVKPPLTELVDFGWFGIIAEPLFRFLKWIYGYVPNYGWAIILMTLAINMILFPLKVKSWRSMQKMQTVMPEVRAIQDRYKKYAMRDPRKQQMQTEVMAVYKREGINPMGGCLPMVIQMPIWIALYQMLNAAIELRHAPWIGWIRDLSAPDAYYILPLLMALTMYVMQKMTPVMTADPAQQRMMTMMPIIFGGMFVIIPISSGLVLYILTSNLVGMAQQWYLNRSGTPAAAGGKHGKAKG